MLRILLLAALLAAAACSQKSGPYRPSADPEAELQAALAKAGEDQKKVLVLFGANWCPDCLSLDDKFKQAPLSTTIDQNFHLVYVDVGNFDRNLEFVRRFGSPISVGIPSLAITDADERVLFVAEAGQFASARSAKADSLNTWFTQKLKNIDTSPSAL